MFVVLMNLNAITFQSSVTVSGLSGVFSQWSSLSLKPESWDTEAVMESSALDYVAILIALNTR